MNTLLRIASLVRNLFSPRSRARELDEELRSYVEHLSDEKRAGGQDGEDARRSAWIELGGLEQVKEEVRQVQAGRMLEDLVQDLRFGLRTLRRDRSFTLLAILALTLGIGLNTIMFTIAHGMLASSLPYADSDRIIVVSMRYFHRDFAFGTMCLRDFLIWKANNRAFEDPAIFQSTRVNVGGGERFPEEVQGAIVSARFFATLAARPLIGRAFLSGEDDPGTRSVSVLSESLWKRRFGSNASVLGNKILVNGVASEVVGIMPGSVRFPGRATEIWTNLRLNPPARYGPWFYRGVARLRPGVSLQQARAEADGIAVLMMQANPNYKRLALPMLSLRDALLGTTLKPALRILIGAVACVLLIAIVNVATLLLARGAARHKEVALRVSLGAGRGRLVRQLVTESVLLAVIAGLPAMALAWGGINFVRIWNPGNLPLIEAVQFDWRALAFLLGIAVCSGVLFGLAPALEIANIDLHATIKEGGRTAMVERKTGRVRSALIVSEIAISLVLLVGAILLLRSFRNLQNVTGGFSVAPRRILTMLISPGSDRYNNPDRGLAFYDEVLRRARAVPGTESAAVTDSLPPDRQGDADSFGIEGQHLETGEINAIISRVTAGPGFFESLGIPLIRGRVFDNRDTPLSAPVAIVSEGFVRRFLPNRDPLGVRIKQSGAQFTGNWMEIVGVVGNINYLGLTINTDPAYYMPFAQSYNSQMFLVMRTAGDAEDVAQAVKRSVQSIDPAVTLAQIETMDTAMRTSISQPRFDTMLLSLFAGIAIFLAAIGIYGIMAYAVAQRTQELGVRMALGAARGDVVRLVMRQSATLALAGVLIGLIVAIALSGLLRSLLFGVDTRDLLTFTASPVGIMLIVLLASGVPALRATRISPTIAMR